MPASHFYSNYVVVLIDILGQKEAFKKLNSSLMRDNPEFKTKLKEVDFETAIFIDKFRDIFSAYFDAISDPNYDKKINIAPEQLREFLKMRKINIKQYVFSDTIEAFVSLYSQDYFSPAVNGIFALFTACGMNLLWSLGLMKKVFRAGIEIGIGTELSSGEIYGPALVEAYRLESKLADYPRILIGNTILEFLDALQSEIKQTPSQPPRDIRFCKLMAEKCRRMISIDSDNKTILNYLGKEIENIFKTLPMLPDMPSYEEIIQNAFKFIAIEIERFKQSKNMKLLKKYQLMEEYFKRERPDIISV